MMDFLKKQKNQLLILLLFALVIALVLEIACWRFDTTHIFSSEKASAFDPSTCQVQAYGYRVYDQGQYAQELDDPQIWLTDIQPEVKTVLMTFHSQFFTASRCQVYYAADGVFSEENSFVHMIPAGADYLILPLPDGDHNQIRIDIDSDFALDDILLTNGTVTPARAAVSPFSILRVLVVFLLLGGIGLLFRQWLLSKSPRKLTHTELLFILAMLGFYFFWAIAKRFDYAPDEAMRYDVTKFIFDHNRLPINDELLSIWGFSYAHLPTVLCNQVGYVFMKLTSLFTSNPYTLLLSARMVSVLSGTGSVYILIKLTKLLFRTPTRWIAIIGIACMPQFAFVSSYINNDSVAFFGIALILYSWALGMKDNWNFKNAALLVIGLSICILSYYNSYGWVLLSVVFFIVSYLLQNKKDYKGLFKYGGIIAAATFLLAGHIFIRHFILYNDLLGFQTLDYYGELYAIDSLRPGNRPSSAEMGIPLRAMLVDRGWLSSTYLSFIAGFGYMNVFAPYLVYNLVSAFAGVAVLGCLFGLLRRIWKKQKPQTLKLIFYAFLLIGAVVAIALSIYNSYCSDYQPQGRYCYPAFMAIAIFAAWGYESLLSLIKKDTHRYALLAALCTAFTAISFFVFHSVYLPS